MLRRDCPDVNAALGLLDRLEDAEDGHDDHRRADDAAQEASRAPARAESLQDVALEDGGGAGTAVDTVAAADDKDEDAATAEEA